MFIDKSSDKQKEHFKYGINQWTGEPNKPVFYTEEMKKNGDRLCWKGQEID